ncbi:hypothetical protein LIER_26809 [Lithospermum erythrorhizon]|uniref:Uncharacterized protein n=1 Tax=Lithospermum erythrorhizon TaxID=34254 RepID=A0AAV3RB88_LITER
MNAINGPRVFELRRSVYTTKQGSDSVALFFNKIKRLWEELAILKPEPAAALNGEERMMKFLMGLGDKYDAIMNQIFLMDLLPTVAKTYSMVSEVEKRRVLQSTALEEADNTVMQIKNYTENRQQVVAGRGGFRRREDKSHLKCENYGRIVHVKAGYFKLVGYP